MTHLTAKQQKHLAKKIRACKDKTFPKRGGGKQLATMLGISPQLLTNWMAGTRIPTLPQLAKLAHIFNVSMHELCALPYAKRKSSASDLVIALTKHHEQARKVESGTREERKRLNAIKSHIYNELGDYV